MQQSSFGISLYNASAIDNNQELLVSDRHCPFPAAALGVRRAFDARYNNVGNRGLPNAILEKAYDFNAEKILLQFKGAHGHAN